MNDGMKEYFPLLTDNAKRVTLLRAACLVEGLVESVSNMDYLAQADKDALEYAISVLTRIGNDYENPAQLKGGRPRDISKADIETLRYKWLSGKFASKDDLKKHIREEWNPKKDVMKKTVRYILTGKY